MTKVYKKQIGGAHYKSMKIQPAQFINENNLPFAEGNAIKYICRHKHKGEVQDLEKAKHYIDMIIERDYGPQESWVAGYNKWKELQKKGVISDKVKLGDLQVKYNTDSQGTGSINNIMDVYPWLQSYLGAYMLGGAGAFQMRVVRG